MKQEEKSLLIRDLCARLPYGVKVQSYSYEEDIETIETLWEIDSDGYMSTIECDTLKHTMKPYLFPLSSMTEEQKEEYQDLLDNQYSFDANGNIFTLQDFYCKYHIDYRGLIPMGLANDATGLNIY